MALWAYHISYYNSNISNSFSSKEFNQQTMKLIQSIIVLTTILAQTLATPAQANGKKPAECYGGGMEQNPPLKNPNTPPCWYKKSNGKYHCYDYKKGTKECPWSGYENPKPK
jgi:hypothetical protein